MNFKLNAIARDNYTVVDPQMSNQQFVVDQGKNYYDYDYDCSLLCCTPRRISLIWIRIDCPHNYN